MAGPKDLLTPEQYERWLTQHRMTEKARVHRLKLEDNPIKALPEEERGELPQTFSISEAYWHPLLCECGSCNSTLSKVIKDTRLNTRPMPSAVRSVMNPLPELSGQALRHLLDVIEAFLSSQDEHSKQLEEQD